MVRLSVSQIKTFLGSKSKRAGQYILGVKDEFESDALPLWHLFEHRVFTGEDNFAILEKTKILDKKRLLEQYENLKFNATWLEFTPGQQQVMIRGSFRLGVDFIGFIDNLVDGEIQDIKTCSYLTNIDNRTPNSRSGLSYYEEYELQLRLYMKFSGYRAWKIIEIAKHRYADNMPHHQIIDFVWSDKRDQNMESKYFPIIDEMLAYYTKFSDRL